MVSSGHLYDTTTIHPNHGSNWHLCIMPNMPKTVVGRIWLFTSSKKNPPTVDMQSQTELENLY